MKPGIAVVLVASIGVIGCIDRARVNERCEWSQEAADSLNLSDRQLERHLDRDVELATDLAVRYADAVGKQRFGSEGHGGLIDGGQLRDRCMATLLSAVATTHHVPPDRVAAVRTRGRRPIAWDVMVIVLFACLYAVVSWPVAGAISRRFPPDEGWAALVAPATASVGISLLAIGLFDLWALAFEIVRLGNDHLSGYRASWSPWSGHLTALYIGGIALFVAAAGCRHRFTRRAPSGVAETSYSH